MNKGNLKKAITFIVMSAIICGSISYIVPQIKTMRDVIELLLNWFCMGIVISCIKTLMTFIMTKIEENEDTDIH